MGAKHHPRVKITCHVCNREKLVFYADTIRRNVLYCSKSCMGKGRIKPENRRICPQCNKEFRIRGIRRRNLKSWYCSSECYGISQRKIGWEYIESIVLRKSPEYRKWRLEVLRRDKFICQICGDKSGNGHKVILHADHIKAWKDYPELRFNLDNGRTLCMDCHIKTDTWGRRKIKK